MELQGLLNALPGAAAQGMIWGIMAIGVYITFKILDLADLTVDGSMVTGMAVCAMLMAAGWNVWAAMAVAFVAGMLTGALTGFFHTILGIPAILAGILTQLILWSVNLKIMGKANQALPARTFPVLITQLRKYEALVFLALICVAMIALLYCFFGTKFGASIRATGCNERMARAQGINTNRNIVLGLMISNGLVALSGALLAQFQSFADINMGRGAIVTGLAAIIIGEVAFGKLFRNFALKLTAVSLGAIIYYVVIQAVISLLDIDSNYLKLISALVVAVFLAIPNLRGKVFHKKASNAGKESSHA